MNPLFANIFAVKRYALHDGPNIRTSIFFKGCPLSCIWCHNPEGIGFASKILYLAEKCVGCGECVEHCPEKALRLTEGGVTRASDKCSFCATCVDTCPALAHEATGRRMSIAEIIADIKKEMPFFDQSGGGITCSGGEPLSQPESLQMLLQTCGQLGIHRAVDTSGFTPTATLLSIAQDVDLFLYDIKQMDSDLHKKYTGVANDLILSNLKALSDDGHPIRVRIPLIGGVNDDEKNIRATGAFVANCKGVQGIDLLPYHSSATAKYRKLGLEYEGAQLTTPTKEHIADVKELLKSYGIEVNIGG